MEKAVNRSEKAEAIVELNRTFMDANLMVITRQSGLTVQEVTDLRRKIRAAGASYKVTKNRLTLRALEGTPFTALGPMVTGPTAIAYSKDPVAAAKVRGSENIPAPTMEPTTIAVSANKESFCAGCDVI